MKETNSGEQIEIVVTDEMIEAGLAELREHTFSEDFKYLLETVFRAMAYASPDASLTRLSK